jgi:hypothetical protein
LHPFPVKTPKEKNYPVEQQSSRKKEHRIGPNLLEKTKNRKQKTYFQLSS